jgi:hypothetical protein
MAPLMMKIQHVLAALLVVVAAAGKGQTPRGTDAKGATVPNNAVVIGVVPCAIGSP